MIYKGMRHRVFDILEEAYEGIDCEVDTRHDKAIRDLAAADLLASPERARTRTICGSMRMWRQMLHVAAEETAAGQIVLAPFVTLHGDEQHGDHKAMLDELHKAKIRMSSGIIVVSDETGYYGESTSREIRYAGELGLSVEHRNVTLPAPQRPRDGVYVRVSDEPVTKTWEPFEGVHVDMDAEQRPVGFEFLAAKSVEVDGDQVAPPPSDEAVIEDLASRMRLAYNGCSAVTDQWRHVASVAVAHLAALRGEQAHD